MRVDQKKGWSRLFTISESLITIRSKGLRLPIWTVVHLFWPKKVTRIFDGYWPVSQLIHLLRQQATVQKDRSKKRKNELSTPIWGACRLIDFECWPECIESASALPTDVGHYAGRNAGPDKTHQANAGTGRWPHLSWPLAGQFTKLSLPVVSA